MTDHDDTFAGQLKDSVDQRDALAQLMNGPGWVIVNTWLQDEINSRRRAYEEGAPHTANDAPVIVYQRAQLGMLRTLQDLPKKLLEAEQDAIDQMTITAGEYDAET